MRDIALTLRSLALLRRFPAWAHPIVIGAALPFYQLVAVPTGLVVLALSFAVVLFRFGWIVVPIALGVMLLATAAGAIGGAAYGLVASIAPGRSRTHHLIRWVAAVEAYFLTFCLAVFIALPRPSDLQLASPLVLLTVLAAGLLFGLVIGSILYEPEDPYEFLNRRGA